jgi:hypothetical protein
VNPIPEMRVLDWTKLRQGGACRWGGSEVGKGPASHLWAQVSGN